MTDGRSVLDVLGPWFTLLCFDIDPKTRSAFRQAATLLNVPLQVVDLQEPAIRSLYGGVGFVLVRPDMMVAWRGDQSQDAMAILQRVRGAPATARSA